MDVQLVESQLSQLGRAVNDTQAAMGAVAGILNTAKVRLGKASIPITPATTYAALAAQEADFTGYAAQALTWDVPNTASDGTVECVSTPLVFRPTDAVVDDSIYNVWVSNTGGTAWYLAGAIVGGPIPMANALDQMIVTIRFRPATQSLCVIIS